MASFWRPGYDPRRRMLPAIAEDAEEENAALPTTTHAGPSNAGAGPGPKQHGQDERDRDTSGSARDDTSRSLAEGGDSPSEPPRTRAERLALRLARNPEFRPRPGAGYAEEEVRLWLLGVMHVLAEVREGVSVLRERIARRDAVSSQFAAQQPVRDHGSMSEQLTYDDVERFVQLAAAEYQRRFAEEP